MKISKSTIIRTLILLLVIINMVLRYFGIDPLNISENEIATAVELIIELLAIIAAWWYNNSFSHNALKAQKFLQELKEEESNV